MFIQLISYDTKNRNKIKFQHNHLYDYLFKKNYNQSFLEQWSKKQTSPIKLIGFSDINLYGITLLNLNFEWKMQFFVVYFQNYK